MSNSYQKIYRAGIFSLARSLIIKSQATADAINRQIQRESIATGLTVLLQQPETWRYYRNIAGLYHPTDTQMTIVSLDTAEEISFDKETLLDHRTTVRVYSQYGTFYKELVKRYPEQEQLIRGILNPVDIQVAINAPDHTILGWDATLVEPQEDDLILVLQSRIQKWFKRWYIPDFSIHHPLFPTTAIGNCIAHVPAFIEAIRLENCHTRKVHSFHIWQFLDNFGDFSKYRRAVTIEQALWLYRNIRWLKANAGRKEAFERTLENILTRRFIPLGQYEMRHDVNEITDKLYPEPVMRRIALNVHDVNPLQVKQLSVPQVLELEIPFARDNLRQLDETKVMTEKALARSGITALPTKVLESEMSDNTQRKPYSLADVLMKHWIFYASTDRYTTIVSIRNPNNGDLIRMTSKEAVIWWYYGMNRLYGVDLLDSQIPTLYVDYVRKRQPPTRTELRKIVSQTKVNEADIRECLDDVFPIEQVISTETFYYLCEDIHARMLKHYRQFTRAEHHARRGQLEGLVNACYRNAACTLVETPQTFRAFFLSKGWTLNELSLDDIKLTVETTLQLATGADLAQSLTLAELQRSLLGLMSTLTAYSNQYIPSMNVGPALATHVTRARLDNVKVSINTAVFVHQNDTTGLALTGGYNGRVFTDHGAATHVSVRRHVVPAKLKVPTVLDVRNDFWAEQRLFVHTGESSLRKVTWVF